MALPILRRGSSPVTVRRDDNSNQRLPINRVDPWNDFAVMDRLLDTLFQSPASLFGRGMASASQAAEPTFELYETADDLLAYLYAPGMTRDGFDISASADTITIRGERRPLMEGTEGLTSHTPWAGQATGTSRFSTSYSLPVEIDPNKVEASYKDGVLLVRMAKSEAAKPRQVKVAVGAARQTTTE